ncbi:vegetative cell wall protein gp1-like [Phoenix dactylifera]|uniref:Vegetative cell wall protein gp1-like n=1 Tax=Phoenix dactylifera TaxID=42345 RepID=A0A8B8J5S2_PHODC|nr:vegetative cell wall protein gp1-like [Phoenix dactylifera]
MRWCGAAGLRGRRRRRTRSLLSLRLDIKVEGGRGRWMRRGLRRRLPFVLPDMLESRSVLQELEELCKPFFSKASSNRSEAALPRRRSSASLAVTGAGSLVPAVGATPAAAQQAAPPSPIPDLPLQKKKEPAEEGGCVMSPPTASPPICGPGGIWPETHKGARLTPGDTIGAAVPRDAWPGSRWNEAGRTRTCSSSPTPAEHNHPLPTHRQLPRPAAPAKSSPLLPPPPPPPRRPLPATASTSLPSIHPQVHRRPPPPRASPPPPLSRPPWRMSSSAANARPARGRTATR